MGAIATTVSYMESMSADDQEKVKNFAAYVASKHLTEDSFEPLSEEQLLAILEHSDKQYHEGKYQDAKQAITQARKQHGFI